MTHKQSLIHRPFCLALSILAFGGAFAGCGSSDNSAVCGGHGTLTDGKCSCAAGYKEQGGTCVANAACSCTGPNEECGAASKCVCKSGFVRKGTDCVEDKAAACQLDASLKQPNAGYASYYIAEATADIDGDPGTHTSRYKLAGGREVVLAGGQAFVTSTKFTDGSVGLEVATSGNLQDLPNDPNYKFTVDVFKTYMALEELTKSKTAGTNRIARFGQGSTSGYKSYYDAVPAERKRCYFATSSTTSVGTELDAIGTLEICLSLNTNFAKGEPLKLVINGQLDPDGKKAAARLGLPSECLCYDPLGVQVACP